MINDIKVEMFKVQEGVVQTTLVVKTGTAISKVGVVWDLNSHTRLQKAVDEIEAAVLEVAQSDLGLQKSPQGANA